MRSALATVGSIAVKAEEEFSSCCSFGPGKFLLGADVKEEKIAVVDGRNNGPLDL